MPVVCAQALCNGDAADLTMRICESVGMRTNEDCGWGEG
jgi:hypothetical protein